MLPLVSFLFQVVSQDLSVDAKGRRRRRCTGTTGGGDGGSCTGNIGSVESETGSVYVKWQMQIWRNGRRHNPYGMLILFQIKEENAADDENDGREGYKGGC